MDYKLSGGWTAVLAIAVLWELLWKGMALWKAARTNDRVWYVAILLVNSIGILPILYLLLHAGIEHDTK